MSFDLVKSLVKIFSFLILLSSFKDFEMKTIRKKDLYKTLSDNDLKIDDAIFILESNNASVFELKNKELLVLPQRQPLDENYPILIFENQAQIDSCVANDFFPIEEKFLTLKEKEYKRMSKVEDSIVHYLTFLNSYLNLSLNTDYSEIDVETTYNHLSKLTLKKIKDPEKFSKALLSFSLLYMNFLVNNQSASWIKKKSYDTYNPTCELFISLNDKVLSIYVATIILFQGVVKDDFNYYKRFVRP